MAVAVVLPVVAVVVEVGFFFSFLFFASLGFENVVTPNVGLNWLWMFAMHTSLTGFSLFGWTALAHPAIWQR